jgi:hypothetical protein
LAPCIAPERPRRPLRVGRLTSPAHFGNMNCTCSRNCQVGPSSGWTTL